MSLQSIKSEICQLLNLSSISATEAKLLPQSSGITSKWSKTETWEELLNNIKASQPALQASVTDETAKEVESITEEVKEPVIDSRVIVEPVTKASSFIDLVLANKIWFYSQYKISNISFPSNTKAVMYSELLQDSFVITKSSNYSISFKTINQVLETIHELFTFDWMNLANYYFDLRDSKLLDNSVQIVYKSIKLPRYANKANQLILSVANFKQQNTTNYSSRNIKTFKDWVRVMYLELPEKYLESFLAGLRRNYSRQEIEKVNECFQSIDKVTGKILNNNARTGSMAFYNEPHIDIKGRQQDKKAVYLTRNEDRYTPVVDIYYQIKVGKLFELLDIEVDMSSYIRYAGFCGYWKLVVISHILKRTQFSVANDWMRIVSTGLRLNGDEFGSYVLVEEIDNKRFNNKIRITSDTVFKLPEDSSGKIASNYMEATTVKVIERIEVKHSNMLSSNGRPKSVKNTNKGGKSANYIKLAETNNYEIRLFYLEKGSKKRPHESYKDVLANIVYVEKQTTIAHEIGQIWIKQSRRSKNKILSFYYPQQANLNDGLANQDLERKLLTFKRHIERLSSKIRELREKREDTKTRQFNLLNERVITDNTGSAVSVVSEDELAKELRGLIAEKLSYELQIKAYDLKLPHEVILTLHEIGINLVSCEIVPRKVSWDRIFTTLILRTSDLKDNPIIIKGAKHD